MNPEDRLREATRSYTDPIQPAPDAWVRIRERVDAEPRRRRVPAARVALAGFAAAVVIALLVTLVAVVRDDNGGTGVTATPGGVAPSQIVAATEDGRLVVLDAATGAEIRTLADGLDAGTTVAVTPDGERVFFDRRSSPQSDPPRELLTVPTGGGEPDRLIGGAGQPAVSPDGRLLAFVRYQPPGLQVVEVPDTFEGWIPNVVGDGEVSGTSQAVLAPSWAPDSRHIAYTVVAPEGSPPRVTELGYGMRLDAVPPIPVPLVSCAVTSYLGDTGLVVLTRGGDRAIAVDPASGREVRELFRGPGLGCGADRPPASDPSGAHLLYVTSGAAPELYRWSEGDAEPIKIADGIVAAAWLAPPT